MHEVRIYKSDSDFSGPHVPGLAPCVSLILSQTVLTVLTVLWPQTTGAVLNTTLASRLASPYSVPRNNGADSR